MKRFYYTIFFCCQIGLAQVGINTTTPNAQLEIKSSNEATPANTDGLIVPKVNVFPATNPTIAQQGMMVYLTAASGSNTPGFYYWDNAPALWTPIAQKSSWSLFGNNAINPSVNFLGTKDFQPLIFKQNNLEVARLRDNNVFNIGYFNPVSFDYSASGFDTAKLFINSDDNDNNVIFQSFNNTNNPIVMYFGKGRGTNASPAIISNSDELGRISFSGYNGAEFNTGADIRSFVDGTPSLTSMPSDIRFLTTPDGSNSLLQRMVIRSNGNVGIGVFNALDKLHVLGNIRMVDGNQAAGKILTSDANGTATWQNASANVWGLTGNAATNPTTNFIGTTDDFDLVFRRANVQSGRIGTSNTFFGRLSGSAATANNNTYIGTEAGRDNVNGQQNVFIGRRAGTFGTTGSDNILIGNGAGILNEASQNCFTGSFSGNGTTTGANNSFYGNASGSANGTGSQNAFFGASTGDTNTTGIGNTLLGTNSDVGANNLTNASAIGYNSMVEASNSLVLGSVNGFNGATSSVNVGIGTTTPASRLHVVGNIRMVDGNQAAGRVLTADANGTATWQNASANAWGLTGNTATNATTNFIGTTDNVDLVFRRNNISSGRIGLTNTFFGNNSGVVNTGDYNTFIGERAGFANTTGEDNTFLGRMAGANGTFGSDNSYIGYGAGLNSTGNSNVIFGAFAGQNTTGNSNVFVGNQSGGTNTTGARNTLLGFNSDVGAAGLSNATAIGNLAQVDASNSLVLGSINGVNGSLVSTSVGIGTTTPQSPLEVARANLITSSTGEGIVNVRSSGAQAIDAGGSVTLGGAIDAAGTTNRVFGSVEGRKSNATASNTSGYLMFKTNDNVALSERMRITDAGDVGIGTATPDHKLHIAENTTSTTIGQLYLEQQGTGDAVVHIGNTGARHFNLGLDTSADSFKIATSATTATALTTGTLMTIQATGEVGIGTAAPAEKLHVSGPAGLTAVRIANTSGTGATSNVALDFFRSTAINTDWRIYNIGANLTIGNSGDDLATVNDLYQFQGARFIPMNDGTQSLGQAANRWNTVFATNGTISTSDRREKKEIQALHYGLNQLLQLKPVSFQWKNPQIDNSSKHLGFIAQDLQQVLPEVVVDSEWMEAANGRKTWEKTPLLGVNYGEMIPVLVQSIQEQQTIIEAQKREIEQQKKLLESVLQRLTALEQK